MQGATDSGSIAQFPTFERFSVGIVAEFDFIDRLGYDQLQRVSASVCFCVLIFTHCFSDLDLFLQKALF